MKHQGQLLTGIAIFSALLLLGFLVIKSRSVNFEQYRQYRTVLAQQLEENALINQAVLQARYNLLTSYDPLVASVETQASLQEALYNFPSFIDSHRGRKSEALLDQNGDHLEQKEFLIEEFKSQNAVLKNSLTYLPTLFQELRQTKEIGPLLESLVDNVLLYSLSSDENLVPQIQNQIDYIQQRLLESQPDTGAGRGLAIDQLTQDGQLNIRQGIELVLAHTGVILEHKPQVDQLVQKILTLPIADGIEQVRATHEQHYQSAINTANIYRLLTFGWLLVILGGLTYVIVAKLRDSDQRNITVLESITDAFIALDRQWRVTYVNSQAAELLQQNVSKLLNQNFWQISPIALGSRQVQHYERAVAEQHVVLFESFCSRTNSWLEVRLYPSKESLSIFLQDVTERKKSETQLRQLNQELEEANRSKSEFLANMSHELRTPLNAIIGYSEILEEEAEEAGWEPFLPDIRKIRGSGKHLLSLINDVLDLAKIEAGRMELHLETFEILSMTRDVVSTIKPLVQRNANRLILVCPENIGRMHADQTKIRQALLNLLSNACKFTERGEITISVEKEQPNNQETWIYFKVCDTGIGMTEDQLGRIFDAFTQADSSTTRQYGGTGLGLTITKRLINTMGGDVLVESQYGRGAAFTLKLPQIAPQSVQAAMTAPKHPRKIAKLPSNQGSFGTVLAIEDDPNTRDLLQRSISKMGYKVVCTGSGRQGLKLAEELKPSVITLDVMLPGMDGWAVLSALKQNPAVAKIPVIMLTMIDDSHLGYTLGAADYLIKPISYNHLSKVLEKYSLCPINREILVVEDDSHAREMMCRLVEREGWLAQEAANGYQALKILQKTQPKLILLDLMMPDMDGFEFLRRLQQQPQWQSIPVMVITAKDLTHAEFNQLHQMAQSIHLKGEFNRQEFLEEVNGLISTTVK